MHKIFLSVTSMIVTHFALKVARKLKQNPDQVSKEELYRDKKAVEEQWLRDHQPKRPVAEVDGKMMECDPSATLAYLDTIADRMNELKEVLRPYRSPDQGDAMALRP